MSAVCDVTISDFPRGGHPNSVAQSWRRGQEGLGQSVFDQWSQSDKPHGCAADPGTIRILSRRKPGHQNPIKIHQTSSKSIKIQKNLLQFSPCTNHQNPLESIKIHQNQSESIKINQNPSTSSNLASCEMRSPSKSIRIHQNH